MCTRLRLITVCSLLIAKSVLGLNLLAFAHARQYGMDRREQEDQVNDFGRKPIGDSQAEQVGVSFLICSEPAELTVPTFPIHNRNIPSK